MHTELTGRSGKVQCIFQSSEKKSLKRVSFVSTFVVTGQKKKKKQVRRGRGDLLGIEEVQAQRAENHE